MSTSPRRPTNFSPHLMLNLPVSISSPRSINLATLVDPSSQEMVLPQRTSPSLLITTLNPSFHLHPPISTTHQTFLGNSMTSRPRYRKLQSSAVLMFHLSTPTFPMMKVSLLHVKHCLGMVTLTPPYLTSNLSCHMY